MKYKYFPFFFSLIPVFVFLVIFISLVSSPYTGLKFQRSDNGWAIASADRAIHSNKLDPYIGKQIQSIAGRQIQQDDLIKDLDERVNKQNMLAMKDPIFYFRNHIKKGETVEIVFRDQSLKPLMITPSDYPVFYYFATSYILLILALSTLVLGCIIFFKSPGDIRVIAFYILSMALSTYEINITMNLSRDLSIDPYIFIVNYYLGAVAGYSILYYTLHFSLVFPKPMPMTSTWIYRASLYFMPSLIVVVTMPLSIYPAPPIILLILTIAAIIYNYLTIASPEMKAQLRVILFGFVFTIFIALATYFFPMFLVGKTIINSQILMLLTFVLPLSMAFAITKYKLMDIDNLFDSTLIYTLTVGLIALLDIIIVYLLSSTKIPFFSFSTPVLTLVAIWVVIFTYLPLREKLSYFVKKLLKREIYDISKVSLTLSENFISVTSEKAIMSLVVNATNDALHPKKIELCIYNEKGCINSEWKGKCCADISDLPNMPDDIFNGRAGSCAYPEGALIVPLKAVDHPIGYIVLHPKYSGRLYDSNDRKLLKTIGNLAVSAIERIRYREKDMQNAIEKANMSREIHDSVGNTFVQAVLLSDTIGRYSTHPDGQEHISNLKKILSDGINDMRDLLWAVEQSEAKLGELVYYIGHKIESLSAQPGIKFNLTTSLDEEDKLISPGLKLNIIRIIQESITNIIKHANATAVDIVIHQKGGELMFLVKDNGKGFDLEGMNQKEHSYGMRNIKKRCEEVGGHLMIDSTPSKGTEISVSVPIDS